MQVFVTEACTVCQSPACGKIVAKSKRNALMQLMRCAVLVLLALPLSACLGTVVGSAVDVTIEAAKVPFKVGAAVVDVATTDDDDDDD